MREESATLLRGDGVALAYRRIAGRAPTVVFLGGFHSDMTGTKAEHLARWCAARGQAFLRLDYSGHGASGGRFEEGCIGDWAADAEAVIRHATDGPLVLVGSSMGGWIALLLARRLPERLHALVGIAAAPDFTEDLMWAQFPAEICAQIERDGQWLRPSEYGGAYPITRRLIENGRRHLVLRAPIALGVPVRLLHGQRDPDVPWALSLRMAEAITGGDVQVVLVKDGDHRLSREQDLALLERTVEALLT
ncbi:MAG TPA: alpha/beta hydrolase [Acetobacteraceae bacterium]|nr:alpha/beta hydrolase [Acetobacteraceae bacterium]